MLDLKSPGATPRRVCIMRKNAHIAFMKPRHRNRRLAIFGFCAIIAVGGTILLLNALTKNTQFFYNPSDVTLSSFAPKSDIIRIGGLVTPGTLEKGDQLDVTFSVHNFEPPYGNPLPVTYNGILPDLFREDEGVVMTGTLVDGEFIASEILAKHDNEYRPKMPEPQSVN